jgi:NADH-quinone oxidoreductase subunit L
MNPIDFLPLVVLSPLLGFVLLAFSRTRMSENSAALIGVGSVGVSALIVAAVAVYFYSCLPATTHHTVSLWTWMQVGSFAPKFAFYVDALSVTMMSVITGVGFFIHLFASWYMRGDEAYGRFFSYMNLFVAAMLILVLGDSLPVLFVGWEGVGLASYLLIGFWYQDPANGAAARKAFVITRVGDTVMVIGLFMLFQHLGTLDIQAILTLAPQQFMVGDTTVTIIALLLLGGAVGKSAQLPLQTWLPDAMAGPTPVSALIHAATMVTAGVYLIARTHTLFELSPVALHAVAVVGAVTLLLAGFTALVQTDIKKILAYSTMSQIGYMFLALGVGAWSGAVFHLMTHAFFKALLFLSAGSVILACHHEQNIFKMGGLKDKIPLVFWCFMIGSAALIALPPTAGYFSKDFILESAWANGKTDFYYAGLLGAFLTALYTTRLMVVVFFGNARSHEAETAHGAHSLDHHIPLVVLLVASIVGGFIHLPLESALPVGEHPHVSALVKYAPLLVGLLGMAVAVWLFGKKPELAEKLTANALGAGIKKLWASAFGFDFLYDALLVKPYNLLVRIFSIEPADKLIGLIPAWVSLMSEASTQTQSGRLRWYAASIGLGVVVLIAVLVIL